MPETVPSGYAATSPETKDAAPTSRFDEAPADDDQWLQESEELPRRPRRRLLGVGGNPIALALLAVLLLACGFFAGVRVQKGQSTSSGAPAAGTGGFAARFAGLGKGGQSGARGGSGGVPGTGFSGAPSGFPGAGAGRSGGLTTGQVSYVSGSTLYVTNSQGNTVKVTPTTGAKVTKTVTTKVPAINPGDTVIVQGGQGKNGSIAASSISVSTTSTGSSSSASGASSSGGSGAPALFGCGR